MDADPLLEARQLSPLARRVLRVIVGVIMPRTEDFHVPLEDRLVDLVDNYTTSFPYHMRKAFPFGLYLMEFLPLFIIGKAGRLTGLNEADRERYVHKMVHSNFPPFRDLMKGVKALVMANYYNDPRVCARIGYFIEDHIRQVNAHPHVPAQKTVWTNRPADPMKVTERP